MSFHFSLGDSASCGRNSGAQKSPIFEPKAQRLAVAVYRTNAVSVKNRHLVRPLACYSSQATCVFLGNLLSFAHTLE